MIRRRRNRKKKEESPTVKAVVQVMPDRLAKQVAESLEDGTWQRPAAYAAGAYLIFKFAELRQLRRTNKLLAAR
jgi:hypothetical protein